MLRKVLLVAVIIRLLVVSAEDERDVQSDPSLYFGKVNEVTLCLRADQQRVMIPDSYNLEQFLQAYTKDYAVINARANTKKLFVDDITKVLKAVTSLEFSDQYAYEANAFVYDCDEHGGRAIGSLAFGCHLLYKNADSSHCNGQLTLDNDNYDYRIKSYYDFSSFSFSFLMNIGSLAFTTVRDIDTVGSLVIASNGYWPEPEKFWYFDFEHYPGYDGSDDFELGSPGQFNAQLHIYYHKGNYWNPTSYYD